MNSGALMEHRALLVRAVAAVLVRIPVVVAGGGGAGGCGGAGGTGGKTGGSSVALLLLDSTIVCSGSELVAGNAGKGGNGVLGQAGQTQIGAPGSGAGFGCAGGAGG